MTEHENISETEVFNQFCKPIDQLWPSPRWKNAKTLVAVSGGADSVAMLRALEFQRSQVNDSDSLIVFHADHQLRTNSRADHDFVKELAGNLGLSFVSRTRAPVSTTQNNKSEEALRDFRYTEMVKVAREAGARYIATGHHRDDQIETVLFRIFRGTGVAGLSGIPEFRLVDKEVTIVRPLMHHSKEQIVSFLESIKQPFLIDSSNASNDYTRNFIRNEMLPQVRKRFPNVDESVLRMIQVATETNDFINSRAAPLVTESIVSEGPNEVILDCRKLGKDMLLVKASLQAIWRSRNWPQQQMNSAWWNQLAEATSNHEPTILNLPGNIRAERSGNHWTLSKSAD